MERKLGEGLARLPEIESVTCLAVGDKVRISTFWPSPSGEEDRRYTVQRSKSDGPLPKLLAEEMAKTRGFIRTEAGYSPEITPDGLLMKLTSFHCEREEGEEEGERFRVDAAWENDDGDERNYTYVVKRSAAFSSMEKVVEEMLKQIETCMIVDNLFQNTE